MRTFTILALLCFVALANAAWSITYSSYFDSSCSNLDSTISGPVKEGECSYKTRRYLQTGKIINIGDNSLVSCDYEDNNCQDQRGDCRTYDNTVCSPSADNTYSELFTWSANASAPGGYSVHYTSFVDGNCQRVQLSGPLVVGNCDVEYPAEALPQKIYNVTEAFLTSCDDDYWNCTSPKYCFDYYQGECYPFGEGNSFSAKYTWTYTPDETTSTPTLVPGSSGSQTSGSEPGSTGSQSSGSEPGSTGSQSSGSEPGSTGSQSSGSEPGSTGSDTGSTGSETSSQSSTGSATSSESSTGSETSSTPSPTGSASASGSGAGTTDAASPTDEPVGSASSVFLSLSAAFVLALAML